MIAANGGGDYTIREFPAERKRIDIGDYYSDDSVLRQMLSWKPEMSLLTGFSKTLEYYKKNLQPYL
jgi:UDP-glucose 4-epimerase